MRTRVHGRGHPPAVVRAATGHQPRPVRLRRHAVADPPGLARRHGADVHRGAAAPCPARPRQDRRQLAFDDIMRLNGKQTIYQMIQLAERIRERGGEPREPLWYKHEYLRRLDHRIGDRLDGPAHRRDPARRAAGPRGPAAAGRPAPARPAPLPGQRHRRGIRQAGGRAARTLARYFGAHIYGAQDDYKTLLQEDGHRADPPRE